MSCLCWATLHIFARPLSRHWDTSHSAVNCLLTPCSTCQAVVAAGGGHARPGVKKNAPGWCSLTQTQNEILSLSDPKVW